MLRFSFSRAWLGAPILTLALAGFASPGQAESCESIQASIRSKIEAKNAGKRLPVFELRTVDKDDTVVGRVVGSCDNGKKRIVYQTGAKSVGADAPVAVKKSKKLNP
jgi:Protein of unknown function (DUF1161)